MNAGWEAIKSTAVEVLHSKKACASIVGFVASILITLAGRSGIALDPATADALATKLCALIGAYVLAQAHVDNAEKKAAPDLKAVEEEKAKP